MNRTRPIAFLLLVALTLIACQPETIIVERGGYVPEPKPNAPIYLTATPFISEWNDLSYDDIRQVSQIVRFTDYVKGQPIVCYYAYYRDRLELSCVALCGGEAK